jgi:hypothetical protein
MQVVFHIGAHFTDEELLIQTLIQNREILAKVGCVVPDTARYRAQIRDLLVSLKGQAADSETQETLLDSITEHDAFSRIILSNDNFMGYPARLIGRAGLHAQAPARMRALINLFPGAEIEFHLGLINPATLLPALLRAKNDFTYDALMAGNDPMDLRWGPVLQKMLEALEGRRIVVWCNEDMPLVWPEVIRRLAGVNRDAPLEGDFAVLAKIMTQEGLVRLKTYLASHPPQSIEQRRKITSAFLDKFARAEMLEVEVALPGWDTALVEEITAAYDADVAEIAALRGVEFIAP